jgi:hypothetical protein
VKSSFVILRQECGVNETNSCYSYTLKGDLENQQFTISVKGLLDGSFSFSGGIRVAALFDSCVEGCEDAGY